MRPLTDEHRPSGRQDQQREQALDALGLGEMSVLEATNSLPVPVSPRIRISKGAGAARRI